MAIHQDTPERCTENQFMRFLVKNPFQVKYLKIKLNFSLIKVSYALLKHVYTQIMAFNKFLSRIVSSAMN